MFILAVEVFLRFLENCPGYIRRINPYLRMNPDHRFLHLGYKPILIVGCNFTTCR